jgi:hypothetical protein
MAILSLLLLGISFLCALTLVGACVLSGQSRHSEEIGASAEYEEPSTLQPSAPALQTTPRALS